MGHLEGGSKFLDTWILHLQNHVSKVIYYKVLTSPFNNVALFLFLYYNNYHVEGGGLADNQFNAF